MCVGVPMRLGSIDGARGVVEAGGLEVEVALDLIEEPRVGDYLLVHAGYAIERLDPEEAAETLELLRSVIDGEGPA